MYVDRRTWQERRGMTSLNRKRAIESGLAGQSPMTPNPISSLTNALSNPLSNNMGHMGSMMTHNSPVTEIEEINPAKEPKIDINDFNISL